jgi:hypothetical protein
MQRVLIASWIAFAGVVPAFGQTIDLFARHRPAPAPLIGAGIPGLVVVGAILLGRRLLKRK